MRLQFLIIHYGFRLGNSLLRKFDPCAKNIYENDKNKFFDEKQKNSKKVHVNIN